MMKRLAASAPLLKWNELTIRIKQLETELEKEKDEKVKEEKTAELEACKAAMAETEGALTELKASFYDDPTSLVGWMGSLFALADAGLTTFDVSGPGFPHTSLRGLFGDAANSASVYEGAEKVLGAFKRRYEKERGPNKIQLLTRLVPNQFQDGYKGGEYVDAMVERVRQAVYGAEAADALDLVQLNWWDVAAGDAEPTLKALQRLAEDKLEVSEEGEVSVTEPKKIRAVGLVDFPARGVLAAVQAGVPVATLSIPLSLADRTHMAALEMAREYNVKVFARGGLMGGLVSEKYVGAPLPSTTGAPDPDLDDPAAVLEAVNNYGGWDKVQALLREVKAVADKHGVRMQTVALRWLIDMGTFPVATVRWGEAQWSQFGYHYWTGVTPGVDWQLFQVDSFLDVEDMGRLNALGRV